MARKGKMPYPRLLSDLLQDSLKGQPIAQRLREADIWRIWPEVVGPTISCRTQPLRIIDGSLTIAVSSGPWKHELAFLKDMIRQKLNQRLGQDLVKEIVLKSGTVKPPPPPAEESGPRRRKLTPRQLASIDHQAAAIPDEETRRAFVDLMRSSLELE